MAGLQTPEILIIDTQPERRRCLSDYLSEFFRIQHAVDYASAPVSTNLVLQYCSERLEHDKRQLTDWRFCMGDVPLLFIGHCGSERNGLELLRSGADDYLTIEGESDWCDIPLAINRALQKHERRIAHERAHRDALQHALSMAAILDSVSEGILCFDRTGIIAVFNKHAESIFGYSAEEIIGHRFIELVPSHLAQDAWAFLLSHRTGAEAKFIGAQREYIGQRKNGECFPLRLSVCEAPIGDVLHYVISVADISDNKETEAALHFYMEMDALITKWSTRFINLDVDNIIQETHFALQELGVLTRVDRAELMLYDQDRVFVNCVSEWCEKGISADRPNVQMEPTKLTQAMHAQLQLGLIVACDDVNVLSDWAERSQYELSQVKSFLLLPMTCNDHVIGYLELDCVQHKRQWSVSDKSQLQLTAIMFANAMARRDREIALRVAHEELTLAHHSLQHVARMDALTHLANRRHFDEVVQQEFRRAQREHKTLAVILMDVDNFKSYNDNYGHPQGDVCLTQVAQVLINHFQRAGEFCARYGGEEFIVLLPGHDLSEALKAAERVRRGIAELAIQHQYNGYERVVTASFGVAVWESGSGLSLDGLLQCADNALYEAKRAGKNRSMCFGLLSLAGLSKNSA